jgi:hypothetical protein
MIRELRRMKRGGKTCSQSQDIARSVWLGQQRRRENGKYRLWGAILEKVRGMSKKHAGGGSHAKNQRWKRWQEHL